EFAIMNQPSRRDFLATTAATAGLMVLGSGAQGALGANDSITLGFIGVGGMGTGLLNIFKGMPDVRIAAVCDVDERARANAKAAAESGGKGPDRGKTDDLGDFRKLLDRKDIDAVVIATPDHW